jgi:predicted dehydrogenase
MNPIKTALCSFGMSGRVFHAPFIHLHPGFELYGVFERTKNLAEEIYPSIKTFRSLRALLNDADVELIIVNTPNNTHFEYAKSALYAGKHVVVEKPFTVYVKEAELLLDIAKKQNSILTVYQNRRWDSDFKTINDVITKNLLGNIIEAEFHFDRYKPDLSPKLHKETPGPGSGLLYDLGSHLIDQAIQLFGMPSKIFADIRVVRPDSKVEDNFDLTLYYDKLRVRLKSSYLVRESLPGYIVHGINGSFLKPRADVQEADLVAGKSPADPDWGKEPETGSGLLNTVADGKVTREYIQSCRGNYMEFYNTLYKSIRNNESLPVSPEDGRKVIKIIEAAYLSAAEGRIVIV